VRPARAARFEVGTIVAEGKPIEEFEGERYVRETRLRADLSIVKVWRADPAGNLMFRKTARNFNPNMVTAGKVTVVDVEEIVPEGTFDPDCVQTPGTYVDRIVRSTINEKPMIRYDDGICAVLLFDQGLGYWCATSGGRHDFRAGPSAQARAILDSGAFVAGQGKTTAACCAESEDDAGYTIRPQLRSMGADLQNIRYGRKLFNVTEDNLSHLQAEIKEHKIKLVTIEPVYGVPRWRRRSLSRQ